MHRQAESAFEASDVVLEEVRVLVEVDGLERELAETLATVCVGCGLGGDTTAAELGARAVLLQVSDVLLDALWGACLIIHLYESLLSCQSGCVGRARARLRV